MAVVITHSFVSGKGDGLDPSFVQPSHWNEDHDIAGLGNAAEKNVGTTAGTVAAGDHGHANAIPAGAAGFMSGADKTKLDGIAAGAVAAYSALTGLPTLGTVAQYNVV